MAKAMSEREYAAWRRAKKLPGATRKAVQVALKEGRIAKNAEGLIDPEAADAQWEGNTSNERRRVDAEVSKPGVPQASSYSEARAVREALNARLTKIELDQKTGELVRADEVRKEAYQRWRVTRDRLLAVPARVAPTLAGADIKTIQSTLHEAFVEALQELGDE